MADWHWEPVTDDLLDGLPPAALAAVRQVAEELTARESMTFLVVLVLIEDIMEQIEVEVEARLRHPARVEPPLRHRPGSVGRAALDRLCELGVRS